MRRRLLPVAIVAVIVIIGIFIYKSCVQNKEQQVLISHNMLVKQIEELGRLEVVRYNIQDLMDYEKKRKWLPNSKTSLKIVGEVIGCVDLTKIKAEDIRVDKDSVSIILPDPEICNWKIDHSKSKVYNVEYGLWETQELVDEAYKEAEKKLYKEAQNMGIAKESRENTKKVLVPLLKGLGFKKVHIGFKSTEKEQPVPQTIGLEKEY
jgi:hypothetical protein